MESIAEFMRNRETARSGFTGSRLTDQPRAEVANQAKGGGNSGADSRAILVEFKIDTWIIIEASQLLITVAESTRADASGALIRAEWRELGTLNGQELRGELAPSLWSQGLPLADQQIGRGGSH